MEPLLHIDEAWPASDKVRRTVKELFGTIRDFDELVERFVFYVPVVHHLIGDASRTAIPTDIVSHTLAQIMREHPLVVTDLPRTVFRFDEGLIVETELRSFCRTLYAVPTEAWNQTIPLLRMLTVFDHATGRFCVLTPYQYDIQNPIGSHAELTLPVHYFGCYGNRETWFFTDETIRTVSEAQDGPKAAARPLLCYRPPIREFLELADRVLRMLEPKGAAPEEAAVWKAVEAIENDRAIGQMLAIRRENGFHDKTAIPLNESRIDERYRRECYEIIRLYESIFPAA